MIKQIMRAYLDIVRQIIEHGYPKKTRTGIDALAIPGATFRHDLSKGFPLLTTKKVPLRLVASELEFFMKGITDKRWLQERKNHIWDEWCTSGKVPYGTDDETKQQMLAEPDLGPIYGFQWRHFGAKYIDHETDYSGQGIDQLKNLLDLLKSDQDSRRMIVNAWNPVDLDKMALPPCHYCFQVDVIDGKLNLFWDQRSVDVGLGLPFNIASYALLTHLLALETNLIPGTLIGKLGDVHLYKNHLTDDGIYEQLKREPRRLPELKITDFTNIFEWNHQQAKVVDYVPQPPIRLKIAV